MRERICGAKCWWATGKKCRCKCQGKQHGILRPENKNTFEAMVEAMAKKYQLKIILKPEETHDQIRQKVETWVMRRWNQKPPPKAEATKTGESHGIPTETKSHQYSLWEEEVVTKLKTKAKEGKNENIL